MKRRRFYVEWPRGEVTEFDGTLGFVQGDYFYSLEDARKYFESLNQGPQFPGFHG